MRKEFETFLQTIHAETPLDELIKYCQTDEELELALKKAGETPCLKKEEISKEWKEKAWSIFKSEQTEKINTKAIQIKLSVGYHLALQIKDWLLEERQRADIDVFDLNNIISQFISNGLKKYLVANKKAVFPTCGKDELPDRVQVFQSQEKMKEWNERIENLAEKFDVLGKEYYPKQEDIDEAFDELKKVYKDLWI